MKILKIVLVLAVLGVILYLAYTKLIKKPSASVPTINDSAECKLMRDTYNIIPGKSWGTATPEVMGKWTTQRCFAGSGPVVYEKVKPTGIIENVYVYGGMGQTGSTL